MAAKSTNSGLFDSRFGDDSMTIGLLDSRFENDSMNEALLDSRFDTDSMNAGLLDSRFGNDSKNEGLLDSRFQEDSMNEGLLDSRFGNDSKSAALLDSRFEDASMAGGLLDSLFETDSMNAGLLDSRFWNNSANVAIFDLRSIFINIAENIALLDSCGNIQARNQAISDTRAQTFALTLSLLDSRINAPIGGFVKNTSRLFSLYKNGYNIYMKEIISGTETFLGFLDADGSLTLIDEAIADGTYELTCRSVSLFWDDCRDGKKLTVTIAGGVIVTQGIPRILNLRREFIRFYPYLKWSIENEYTLGAITFGVWISDVTPVVTTGDPDYSVQYFENQLDYKLRYAQTAAKYIAVAAQTATETGPVSEIFCDWDSTAPSSPANQLARDEDEI